jgi:poly(beta-D-mannuronate) lyase
MQIGNGAVQIPPGPLNSFDAPDRVRVSFNTFVNNIRSIQMGARSGGIGANDVVFSNNIIKGDTSAQLFRISGPLPNATIENNIVFGAAPIGTLMVPGARRVNPMFTQDNSGVFFLQSVSPAIDSALGSFPEVNMDMDGQSRAGSLDVGADEFLNEGPQRRPLTLGDVGPNAP